MEEDNKAIIKYIAKQMGVDLDYSEIAIATPGNGAKVKMYDGSLEAIIFPTERGEVKINSPRAPGITIELVDHNKDYDAPKDAIYAINAYKIIDNGTEALSGDIPLIYVGKKGLILCDSAIGIIKDSIKKEEFKEKYD